MFSGPVSSPGQQRGLLHHGLFSGIKVQSTLIQTQEFSYAFGPVHVTIFIDDLQRTVEIGYADSPMNTSTIKYLCDFAYLPLNKFVPVIVREGPERQVRKYSKDALKD